MEMVVVVVAWLGPHLLLFLVLQLFFPFLFLCPAPLLLFLSSLTSMPPCQLPHTH
uniref:Uncharacterized protein n=1 Tax=Arundo donax TaxID=35708 RepID=A0A0A8ZWE8_ARUDO